MPPSRDSLIELLPGAAATETFDFGDVQERLDRLERGEQTFVVRARGRYMAVWPGPKDDVTDEELMALTGGSRALTGGFESNELVISWS